MLKLLKQDENTGLFNCHIPGPMSVKGYLFTVQGLAGLTAVNEYDVGRLYLFGRNAAPLVSIDFDVLQCINDLWMGTPFAFNSGVASNTYYFVVYIPRNYLDDNVERIEPDDNMNFRINFNPNLAANTASGFIARLYADLDEGITQYQLTCAQQDETFAGGPHIMVINHENITKIYMTDRDTAGETCGVVAAAIDRIGCDLGVDNASAMTTDWLYYTNLKKHIEIDWQTFTNVKRDKIIEIWSAEGDLTSKLEDKAIINMNIIAGQTQNPAIVTMGALLNPDKLIITDTDSAQRLISAVDRKELRGHVRSSRVLKQLITGGMK